MTEPVRSAKDVLIATYVRADKSRSINDVVDDQLKELVRQGYLDRQSLRRGDIYHCRRGGCDASAVTRRINAVKKILCPRCRRDVLRRRPCDGCYFAPALLAAARDVAEAARDDDLAFDQSMELDEALDG